MLWAGMRTELARCLQEAFVNRHEWTLDGSFTRIQRLDFTNGTLQEIRECTPAEYAADMVKDGIDGHQGGH